MDIQEWFEKGTNLKIKEIRYLSPPSIPYNIFIDDLEIKGADDFNNIIEHNVTFEHYSNILHDKDEEKIINFLDKEKKKYEKSSDWLNNEKLFVTIFELDPFLEKRRK